MYVGIFVKIRMRNLYCKCSYKPVLSYLYDKGGHTVPPSPKCSGLCYM